METSAEGAGSNAEAIAALARRHGLAPVGGIEWNDLGLDFRAAFTTDEEGTDWVLRIPRRPDVWPRAENEARVLDLLKGRLPVEVPDWRIATPDLIAYPRLAGTTAVTVDPVTKEPTWNIAKDNPAFVESFARTLAALHGIDPAEAAAAGLKVSSPEEARRAFADDLDRVKREIGIGESLWRRWRTWLDDDASWPPFTTLVHGDLHVGHVLVDETSRATGLLDWTEAEVSDPAIDFIFHLMGFGESGLERLLDEYEAAGGRTWPGLRRHVDERLAAFPIKYALFALTSGQDERLAAIKEQLGADGESA
ncbi:macrolide 2'-phosphotransferase [Singulisphaera acidiphila]|uniref:Putative aminoglycoside phosphotransferase n=1 Tax=Singulisphaera acidiphila (strain ATCC BAA-1392 / DSM 18658 / VKM B-2454 / MOB10) TaxID=886293 RepID=L0DGN9_SINAD|nr:macrolide 2'-phosphotransferase [Singulisphaera acidiphila]AGA28015.1 putative aminoglycoside phosphotransferase [Singulisphaera acidiphila DSM 18658]